MIAPEGNLQIAITAGISLLFAVLGFLSSTPWLTVSLWMAAAVLILFSLYFFRDPVRPLLSDKDRHGIVLAPADGKVIEIQPDVDKSYINGEVNRISVFLSPLNVHVNRIPTDGQIEYVEYVPGDYLVAWHPKASEKNERSILGMKSTSGSKLVFKQIAGAIARRVVFHLKEGQEVKAGERFGIVKFGSRMDILLEPHVEVDVTVGQVVTAGVPIRCLAISATSGAFRVIVP